MTPDELEERTPLSAFDAEILKALKSKTEPKPSHLAKASARPPATLLRGFVFWGVCTA